jgi:hypothetical protein
MGESMNWTLCGYFPKRKTPLPSGYDLPNVVEIASVSNCIAKGPEDWIKSWQFNELGFFDEVAVAEGLISEGERLGFELYAYRFLDQRFAAGVPELWRLPDLTCEALPANFETLGFDVVSKSQSDFFECSALSCNGGARKFPVNEFCLFKTGDEAILSAVEFSGGNWEPGPYYVAEVLRRPPAKLS